LNQPRETKPVSETLDWKQKSRDSVLEMEAEEKRWRQVEQLLRRLIGRLCAAGMGVDPQLDDQLTSIAAANRHNSDAQELDRLARTLTAAVVAADATSPVRHLASMPSPATLAPAAPMPPRATAPHSAAPAPSPAATPHSAAPMSPPRPSAANADHWDSSRTAVAALLERLLDCEADHTKVRPLMTELAGAESDAALASIIARTADLIHERSESMARERLQAAAVLSQVTTRLEEMAHYLTESKSASRSHFNDTESLNDTVMSHVRELTDEVAGATDLALLQSVVNARLESVAKKVRDFRVREETRVTEYDARAEHMRGRVEELEREAQDLHSKLDREKHGARLDPLTGIANRRSFDERFTQEILRCARAQSPLVMLLLDIDSFKIVNDSYGHRAGDRVLQSVAACFTAALRAGDFVARIGGEEFAVLLSGLQLEPALHIANQLRTAVEALRFHFRGIPVRVTVSCGITELHPGDASEAAFDRADSALYRAKNSGKNLCVAA
jgi:diguanylate cyclase